MKRRDILAGVAGGVSMLTGCLGKRESAEEPTRTRTTEPTPPANVTVFTETEPLPTPSAASVSDREAARSFVERYEQQYVYNELVHGFGSNGAATAIDVESAQAVVVHTTDRGYYLLSSCTGSAEYYDRNGSNSGASRNASAIAHFVGSDTHRRIPFNYYQCSRPGVEQSEKEAGNTPTARFQIYDFDTEPDYDHPEEGGHTVDVTVTDDGGATVLDREYQTSLPLTAQTRVTETPGEYTLSVSLDSEKRLEYEWSLSDPNKPSWWALSILVTNGGELTAKTLYPNETVGLPDSGVCRNI
ncbi:hypothetical protein C440_02378 [Haloferax mucosum ATCC BAA-1512]|uniref:Ig-like domain-containing protein n=1 Tax=Haloferax mucosum ATCC BAA-1512 TaxID=662479 RepID=M0IPW4_9EURY|nr:hypothetical protein [Haloferax mucosum]ELZ98057.1 hypothetical protein C440_02378 [Haloferax mucosum ATCC BAA-1512]